MLLEPHDTEALADEMSREVPFDGERRDFFLLVDSFPARSTFGAPFAAGAARSVPTGASERGRHRLFQYFFSNPIGACSTIFPPQDLQKM